MVIPFPPTRAVRWAAALWLLLSLTAASVLAGDDVLTDDGVGTKPTIRADADPDSLLDSKAPRGYRLLLTRTYENSHFDWEVFDNLWRTWEEPLRKKAEAATLAQRRAMAFSRYGLTPAPGRDSPMPMQYVDNGRGGWSVNCFACHGGKVAGRVIPGLPNSHFAMQTLGEEVRLVKLLQGKIGRRDAAAALFPTGGSNGTTNAVMFGVALAAFRDKDLNLHHDRPIPAFTHHDMDAPPWWNVKKKTGLYADGFAESGHRSLMQFLMVPENSGQRIRGLEDDFKAIYDWILTLEAPKYPFAIDRKLAADGQPIFNRNCARCHGTYGKKETYPNKIVPIDEVGTDRVRLDALTVKHREFYASNWFSHYGKKRVILNPGGYVAPPLDGVWASAPYLHNGSVPTLWHLFHPKERPVLWRRTEDGYDRRKVGLEVTIYDKLPTDVVSGRARRRFFDTRITGKSAAGHRFPEALTAAEKHAVLEYLKTL